MRTGKWAHCWGSQALDWDLEWLGPKYKRNKVLQFCPHSQLASSLTAQKKKRVFISGALRNLQNCCLEDGSWHCESSGMLSAYKCPLTSCGGCVFASASKKFRSEDFYFRKSRPHYSNRPIPQQTIRLQPQAPLLLPTQSQPGRLALVTVSVHFFFMFDGLNLCEISVRA